MNTALAKAPAAADVQSALAISLASRTAETAATLAALEAATVDTDEDYADATAERTRLRLLADEWEATYKTAVAPWQAIVNAIQVAFRPGKQAYAAVDACLRGKLEGYQIEKARALREAEAKAQAAAKANDTPAVVTALATAQAAAAPLGGGRVAFSWEVAGVDAAKLPDAWWCPDLAKIQAVAKAHRGDTPPVIDGVVFKQVVSVAATRRVRT